MKKFILKSKEDWDRVIEFYEFINHEIKVNGKPTKYPCVMVVSLGAPLSEWKLIYKEDFE